MTSDSANITDRERSQKSGKATSTTTGRPGGQVPERGKGFLEERPGHKSAMRAMSFIALLAAIGFGAVTLTHSEASTEGIYITLGFLLAAFTPKALQKFAEEAIPA